MLTQVPKEWGREEIIVNEPEYCAKRLVISPGKKCSLHFHEIKKETFHVEQGIVRLEQYFGDIAEKDELLLPGESRTIYPRTRHRFSSKLGATILEISKHHDDSDVTRLEPSGDL